MLYDSVTWQLLVVVVVVTRTAAWQGPTQQVMLQRGRAYTLTAWVKQLNDKPGKVFQVYRAAVVLRYSDASKRVT